MKIFIQHDTKLLPILFLLTVATGSLAEGTNLSSGFYLAHGKILADYRNVALNAGYATNLEPVCFPRATSNGEYNQRAFAARCAVDGTQRNDNVHGGWLPQSYLTRADQIVKRDNRDGWKLS